MAAKPRTQVDILSWYGLIIAATFPKTIGVSQGIIARQTGRGIWLATILAILLSAILLALVTACMTRLRTNLGTALQRLGGPWLARPMLLVEALFFGLTFLAGNYVFIGHLQYYFLPETPLLFFVAAYGSLALLASIYGFETIARFGIIAAFGSFCITAIMIPGVVWDLDALELFPVAELGWDRFALASGTVLADLVVPIGMAVSIIPMINKQTGLIRHSLLAAALSGLLIIVWPLAEIMLLGPALTAKQAVSCMTLARSAALGVYVHRYELIMVAFFLPAVFLMGALPLFSAAKALSRGLGLKEAKGLFLPILLALSAFSYWTHSDRLRANWFFGDIWPPLILVTAAVLLVAALAAAALRRP